MAEATIIETEEGPSRYEACGLLVDGDRYQIARGRDRESGEAVVLRAIQYPEEVSSEEVIGRRLGLRRQYEFLEASKDVGVTPGPRAFLTLPESPVEPAPEPLLVVDFCEGRVLYEEVVSRHAEGMEPARALEIIEAIAELVAKAHKAKWLIRDFDPRRFLITDDGEVRFVSVGAVVKMGQPLDATQLSFHPAYVAPEIRDELTGSMQRPTADLYGLGCLLSFLVTGEEPREQVESPLSFTAYESLKAWELSGLELLIARLLQPLAKKRIGRAERLKQYLRVESLPKREDRGFEMTMLPAPWLGLEMENPEENLGLRSSLSAGPLVSVRRSETLEEESESETAQASATAEVSAMGWNWPVLLVVLLVFLGALGFALFSGGGG